FAHERRDRPATAPPRSHAAGGLRLRLDSRRAGGGRPRALVGPVLAVAGGVPGSVPPPPGQRVARLARPGPVPPTARRPFVGRTAPRRAGRPALRRGLVPARPDGRPPGPALVARGGAAPGGRRAARRPVRLAARQARGLPAAVLAPRLAGAGPAAGPRAALPEGTGHPVGGRRPVAARRAGHARRLHHPRP